MAKADGSYLRELAKIERQDVIILDDFGLQALDSHNRITLLEIIEDRHNNGSIIVTSQIPVQVLVDLLLHRIGVPLKVLLLRHIVLILV